MKEENIEYSEKIANKLRRLMEIIDLEVPGFAEFLDKSPSHLYGILNGSRFLSESFAREIGDKLGFDGMKIFNLNSNIPNYVNKSEALIRFKNDNKKNVEYFLSAKSKRSIDSFINEVLLNSGLFNDGYKYLKEITNYCKEELNREFQQDELSKGLRYAVSKGVLKSMKRPILLNDGSLGSRMVDVYFR
ncbi:hypothetical protein VB776_21740 [Arcicella sp. DC2W]|uniref:HTH cro/C1-type domain-containing protein n=1 Tax=Arcicella gelida TaxID=2984195 RepID=A0ABU5SAT5_9BACT|nr:hypothetical protein [Arcicella sp. DC2W]MEA5405578.1 hypothetical protein [Arcicella sp. DC2W]